MCISLIRFNLQKIRKNMTEFILLMDMAIYSAIPTSWVVSVWLLLGASLSSSFSTILAGDCSSIHCISEEDGALVLSPRLVDRSLDALLLLRLHLALLQMNQLRRIYHLHVLIINQSSSYKHINLKVIYEC